MLNFNVNFTSVFYSYNLNLPNYYRQVQQNISKSIPLRQNKMASRTADYVDIHGRNLNAMLSDDGTVYLPLNEVKKTGYHIFPITNFNANLVGKAMILAEFRTYMLGAAKEYLLRNSVHGFTHEDILETIEMCRQQLLKDGVKEVASSPSGALGRTLLQNPAEVQHEVRSAFQQTLQNKSGPSSRMPKNFKNKLDHNKKDSHFRGSNSSLDFNKSKINGETNSYDKLNTSQNRNSGPHNNDNYQKPSGLSARLKLDNKFNKKNDGFESDAKSSTPSYEKIKLQRTFQQVKVVHIDITNEKQKYWVQLVENEAELLEIIEKCQEIVNGAQVMPPKIGEIYMAMSKEDDVWYRCMVVKTTPLLKIHFIDFGNDEVVDEVRQLTPELRKYPAQVVRTVLSTDTPKVLENGEIYSVKNAKEYADQTILILLDQSEKKSSPVKQPVEPILMESMKFSTVLVNREMVKIIAFEDGKFYLRNKEHYSLLVQVMEKIKEIPKESLNKVVQNQLVLCKKEEEDILCRAVVRSIEGNEITIQYVDFFTTTKFPLNSLSAVNKQIADIPPALIESPVLRGYHPDKFNGSIKNRIYTEIENKTKFCVLEGLEFDLLFSSDQSSFSEALFPMDLALRPPKVAPKTKESPTKISYQPMKFEDMATFEASLGTKTYLMTHIVDMSEFNITATEAQDVEFVSQCSCIDVQDTEPYEPEDSEMVLACYEGDWYRGGVVQKLDNGKFTVFFVDFGNSADVPVHEIRKFPDDLRKIPIMGMGCQLDVPQTEVINKKFIESIKTDMEYSINIKSHNISESVYIVDIPKFTDILRKENLL